MLEIFGELQHGGPIMVPILICSIIATGIALERMLFLRSGSILPSSLLESLRVLQKPEDLPTIENLANANTSPLGTMLQLLLRHKDQDRAKIVVKLEEWARQYTLEMERGLETLDIVASVSPMLGLMGTVLGMVMTFDSIQSYGLGNIDALAGGISQALLTTLAGLAVGIPSLIAHRYLEKKVDIILLELEGQATIVLNLCEKQQHLEKRIDSLEQ
jgi:biopolymer transport protein ExbB